MSVFRLPLCTLVGGLKDKWFLLHTKLYFSELIPGNNSHLCVSGCLTAMLAITQMRSASFGTKPSLVMSCNITKVSSRVVIFILVDWVLLFLSLFLHDCIFSLFYNYVKCINSQSQMNLCLILCIHAGMFMIERVLLRLLLAASHILLPMRLAVLMLTQI